MKAREARDISSIIDAIGSDHLGDTIDTVLKQSVDFDMSSIFLFRFNRSPLLIHNGYNESVPKQTLSSYIRGGYLLDPFYVACTNDHPGGLWRMSELAPDSFFSSGFSISKDIHPCVSSEHGALVEEIGFIVPLHHKTSIVYSLMRNFNHGQFEEYEIRNLNLALPFISSALEKHYHIKLEDGKAGVEHTDDELEDMFLGMLQDQLTETHRFVVKYILQGHSNSSIANIMKISEGTVKIHKHNIYQRLSISSHSELFRLFIDYLTKAS
jgi:DNA-binding CsgD family transcriptional regulator